MLLQFVFDSKGLANTIDVDGFNLVRHTFRFKRSPEIYILFPFLTNQIICKQS